ncbi:MAG: hypothetical protein AAGI37_01070 [Planctomycetota bacterium]
MDWTNYFFLSELSNRLDIDKANQRMKRMRRRMLDKTSRDHQQDARIEAIEQENDQLKLILIDLIRTLTRSGAITEHDTQSIIERVASATREVHEETEEDRLAGLQQALGEDQDDT